LVIIDGDLNFGFWHEADGVFGAPIYFRMAFLAAKSGNLAGRQSLHTDVGQRFANGVELGWFNNRHYHFHG
jgi:hypothetical protein